MRNLENKEGERRKQGCEERKVNEEREKKRRGGGISEVVLRMRRVKQ